MFLPGHLSFALTLALAIAAPVAAEEGAVAYINAAIETAGKAGRIENGTLVLRSGKIEAVGKEVRIPNDAQVIDARGETILPGILDPFREVSIAAATADAGPRTVVIGGRTITLPGARTGTGGAFTRVADNFYPYESGYRILVRSGITGLNLVTGGYGQSAIVRVTPAQPDAMMINPDGVLFTPITNETSSLDVVRTALETVDKMKKGQTVSIPAAQQPAAEQPPAGLPRPGRGGGRPGARPVGGFPGAATPGLTQATLKPWQAVHEGKSPLFASPANAAAVVHVLKALEPYKDVKLVLVASSSTLYEALDHLAGKPIRVVLRPGLSLKPNTRDRIDVSRVLHEAGLEFAFTQPGSQGDILASQDFPLFSVAYSVKCGLPRKAALEALTARPAAFLGLDKTHGTIEPGKSADLLIFTGDPLDPASQLSKVLIEGRTVYAN